MHALEVVLPSYLTLHRQNKTGRNTAMVMGINQTQVQYYGVQHIPSGNLDVQFGNCMSIHSSYRTDSTQFHNPVMCPGATE